MLLPLTEEQRLIPPLIVGSCLSTGTALQALWRRYRASAWGGLPLALATFIPILLWPLSDARAADAFAYYRVADASLLEVSAFVERRHDGGQVVVRASQYGWPLGWWFEGLTEAPIVVGSHPRWLGFPEERENAQLASRFFDHGLSADAVVALARQHDVSMLVFPKWDWIGWQDWVDDANSPLDVLYDDGTYMILDVRGG